MAEKKIVSRVGVLSYAKISAIISAIIGLILGIVYAIYLPKEGIIGGLGFGLIIIVPIMYGIIGFVFGALSAWVYNIVAKKIGGIEVDLT